MGYIIKQPGRFARSLLIGVETTAKNGLQRSKAPTQSDLTTKFTSKLSSKVQSVTCKKDRSKFLIACIKL